MHRRMVTLTAVMSATLAGAAQANDHEQNWPAWRGPRHNGVAPHADPPISWSESNNVKWKIDLPGTGSSTPIIWGERVFIHTAHDTGESAGGGAARPQPQPDRPRRGKRGGRGGRGGGPSTLYQFDLLCIDRGSGKILWQKTAAKEVPHEGHQPTNSYAPYSPVTDGQYVWLALGSRGVHCYDMDGNHKWSKDLGKLRTRNGFGEGGSPALAGDALIVLMDQEGDSFIYALNKLTGDILWKQTRDEKTTWSTPLIVEVNGRLQAVVNATNKIRSYDVKSGELIWECAGQTDNAIPSPVVSGGVVFCTSGYRGNALQAIELGHTGDLSDSSAIRWQHNERTTPYVPSPLLYGERLYIHSGNQAILSVYNAKTGEPAYTQQRLQGSRQIYASPVGAADRVYLTSREGVVTVIRNSDQFQVLSVNKLDDQIDGTPALVGKEIFIRSHRYLYCIAEQ